MKYQTLLELRVQHAGDSARPCHSLEIRPAQGDGARELARHQLIAKPRSDGLDLLGPVGARERPHIDFDDLVLRFEVIARDPKLAHTNNLERVRKLANPTFRRPRSGNLLRARVGDRPLSPGVLAMIELKNIDASWLGKPRRFVLPLPERSVFWVYYVISRRKGQSPRIDDSDPARALTFAVEQLSPDTAQRDPVGAALLSRHPDRDVYRLATAAPLTPMALHGLSLRIGDQTVLAALPAPPAHQHLSLFAPDAKPRDAIYRVLEL